MKGKSLLACLCPFFLFAQTSRQALDSFLNAPALAGAHAGISIYDPQADSFLVSYQAEKMFLPASNVKLFTLYAGLKFLGDSIPGLQVAEYRNRLAILGTGDPTFLHPRFASQTVFDFLKKSRKKIVLLVPSKEAFRPFGDGWSMDDYDAGYSAEKSRFPVFGNVISFSKKSNSPVFFPSRDMKVKFLPGPTTHLTRGIHDNHFEVTISQDEEEIRLSAPFITSNHLTARFLSDTLRSRVKEQKSDSFLISKLNFNTLYSIPVDTMMSVMMQESDNFLAEQTLLMTSDQTLGKMSDSAMITFLLSGAIQDIPQKPRWADGSGMSRYNLFSPNDMVYILKKLSDDFSFERMKRLLPSGGKGTLSSQFIADEPYLFAKTGTLSNTRCLSGYLRAKSGKWLIFSLIINNLTTDYGSLKKSRESFLNKIREAY